MAATLAGMAQVGAPVVLLAVVYVPFGNYLAAVFSSERHLRIEHALYRVVRVDPDSEQRWTGYAAGVLGFSFASILGLYLLQRLQALLPLSLGRGAVEPGIAFNTAVSFVTNTNWQSDVPETVMGHLVQMAGLTVQNFASAAVGMAVAVALVRGFTRASTDRIGNFWVDLVRGTVRVLLPLSFVAAVALVAMGAAMSFALTTFSLANDLAKYFAILPAMFVTLYPALGSLNVMQLATPRSAILSAVIFNALVIVALIPLDLRGVRYRPTSAARLLRRNLLIYGLGGVVAPFVEIFLIDLAVRLIPGM